MKFTSLRLAAAVCVLAAACTEAGDTGADSDEPKDPIEPVVYEPDPYPSTYAPLTQETVAVTNATILDGVGGQIDGGTLVFSAGRITALGPDAAVPDGAAVIDAQGRWVTPGIIDVHSHLGVYPSPGLNAHSEGNEATSPVTAEVWAEHSVWPQDDGFNAARAGGVTTLTILPGSANLFGGRGVTLRNVPGRTVQDMKFPGAPYVLKMACGENPKRVYSNSGPSTRMANVAGYRAAWQKARDYKQKWDDYVEASGEGEEQDPPSRDFELDTLMGVLNGEIKVQMHCYRADDIGQVLDLMKEFDYQVSAFHHAVEAYKVADKLRDNGVCAAMWADWGGFKAEAYDSIRENIPMVHAAGACALIHSDDAFGVQRLNQEIAKALGDGNRAGLNISKADAWRWVSSNPAKAVGVDGETGSLEVGKRADVVIWSADPFSTYAVADRVYVDGAAVYDRADPALQAVSDFMLGQPAREAN